LTKIIDLHLGVDTLHPALSRLLKRGEIPMKIRWAINVVIVIALGLAAIWGVSLAAPAKSVYVVIELDQITDAAAFDALKKSMGPRAVVETQHADGRYLARSEDITSLDGDSPKAIVIIAFDNQAKAKAYYENTKEITAMRMKAAKSRAFIVTLCSERGSSLAGC